MQVCTCTLYKHHSYSFDRMLTPKFGAVIPIVLASVHMASMTCQTLYMHMHIYVCKFLDSMMPIIGWPQIKQATLIIRCAAHSLDPVTCMLKLKLAYGFYIATVINNIHEILLT